MDRVSLPDGHLTYVDHGDGEVLVLLHGGGVDHRMWDDQVQAFAGYRVITPDARGHGDSSTPAASFRACDDVVALLDHLGIDRAVLAGVSMGAATATDVALEHPERVSALVVSGAGVSNPDFGDPWVLDVLQTWQRTQAAGDAEGWIEAFMKFVPGPHRSMRDVDVAVSAKVDRMVRETLATHIIGRDTPPVQPTPVADTHTRMPQIAVPVLAVVGAADADDHQRLARELATSVTDGRIVTIPGAAHYPNMEKPAEFNAAVRDFLTRLAR